MLNAHIDSVERVLLKKSSVAAASGHTIHKGTPREIFVREFLQSHLGSNLAYGTGEIIDGKSRPGQKRNQIDIVIYRADYPKLDFGGGISAFLAESVVETIEVKSKINKSELSKAIRITKNLRSLDRNPIVPPSSPPLSPILSFVVGYDGPKKMATVYSYLASIHRAENIQFSELPPTIAERRKHSSPSIDGVFVLGKGFLQYDNASVVFRTDADRKNQPAHCWNYTDATTGSLLVLFTLLTQAASSPHNSCFNPSQYIGHVKMPIGGSGT